MKFSCGILLKCDGKYFIGHATGEGKANAWTIFKGEADAGESHEDAAYREFKEETSIDLKKLGVSISFLSSYEMKDKTVKVYSAECDAKLLEGITPICESLVLPHGFPEIDDYKFATVEEARALVYKSQKHLFA